MQNLARKGPSVHTLYRGGKDLKEPIRAESQLLVGGTLTSTEALDRSQRTCLAYWLKETYLNELCRGKATVQTAASRQNHTSTENGKN